MKSNLAVGLFVYNRPSHFKRVLISLENYQIKNLIIFIDGPKNKKDSINQEYIKYMINTSPLKNIKTICRKKNLGLSKSLLDGINYLSKRYDKFIVLEDDCIPYKNFLEYFSYCFRKFEKDKNVNSICSFQFNEIADQNSSELSIRKLPHFIPWGWGTWSHKWNNFKKNKIKDFKNFPIFMKKFNNKKYRFKQKNNIWTLDYVLYQYHYGKKSIYPNVSLLKNIGFDGSGVNSKLSFDFKSSENKITKFIKKYDRNKENINFNKQLKIISKKINLFY